MNAAVELLTPRLTLPAIGAAIAGGFCLAHQFIDGQPYAIIVAPKAQGERADVIWNEFEKRVDGALSAFDGLTNTRAMAAAGSELAQWALSRHIGEFDDWFIPSRADLLAIYGNLEAAGEPFAKGGAEAFEREWYWSSSQLAANDACAWFQSFGWGDQFYGHKSIENRVRLVRRLAI